MNTPILTQWQIFRQTKFWKLLSCLPCPFSNQQIAPKNSILGLSPLDMNPLTIHGFNHEDIMYIANSLKILSYRNFAIYEQIWYQFAVHDILGLQSLYQGNGMVVVNVLLAEESNCTSNGNIICEGYLKGYCLQLLRRSKQGKIGIISIFFC